MNIIIGIGILLGIFLIIAALVPKNVEISSTIEINKPVSEVFDFVVNLKNQENYSVWVMADPNMKPIYSGNVGEIGFSSSWKSDVKNVGEGSQEITALEKDKFYEVELRFIKPFKATNRARTITETLGDNRTLVNTIFYARNPFPMSIMNLFVKNILLKDMNKNAAGLKSLLEGHKSQTNP